MDDGVDPFYLQSNTFNLLVPVRNLICQIARNTFFPPKIRGLGNGICMQNYYTWGLNMGTWIK